MMGLLYRAADALRRRSSGDGAARSQAQGRMGEDVAHRYLRGRGCTVVARNYRMRSGAGEIDLVVWHGKTLVFVEVKTRSSAEFGEPERAVDPEKQQKVVRAGRDYARRAGVEWDQTRFDIVSVVAERTRVRIEWIRDAFR